MCILTDVVRTNRRVEYRDELRNYIIHNAAFKTRKTSLTLFLNMLISKISLDIHYIFSYYNNDIHHVLYIAQLCPNPRQLHIGKC